MPLWPGGEGPVYRGAKTITGALTVGGQVLAQSSLAIGATDTLLVRDAANALAQRNGTAAQQLNIYGTYTDVNNYERFRIVTVGSSSRTFLVQDQAGTGVSRSVVIGTVGDSKLELQVNNDTRWFISPSAGSYALLANVDNTSDIGASAATRPRDIHIARNQLIDAAAVGTSGVGVLGIGNGTEPSTSPADMVQLYSVDLSAGNATLGLRTETAVAADVGLASTHSLTIRLNGASYKWMLTAI